MAELNKEKFEQMILNGEITPNIHLGGIDLREANLRSAFLAGANLSGAKLQKSNLAVANLENANLEGADLRECNLSYTNFRGANLKNANLKKAKQTSRICIFLILGKPTQYHTKHLLLVIQFKFYIQGAAHKSGLFKNSHSVKTT